MYYEFISITWINQCRSLKKKSETNKHRESFYNVWANNKISLGTTRPTFSYIVIKAINQNLFLEILPELSIEINNT